ncbi:hypothetical protein OHA21_47265 [Actinoplanes sp. NBC_00393]|uniref:hypothetical protein n=1 Tax=Actinoplanes sp. NBC_00393 TaxID=2975953 RepID=UPI002E2308B8
MWICVNCGETNADSPDACEVCGHARAGTPERWSPPPLPAPWEPTGREPQPYRWDPEPGGPRTEPRSRRAPAPGFRTGPPPAPRNAPPNVAGPLRAPRPEREQVWIPEPADPVEPEPEHRRLVPAVPIAVLIAALIAAGVLAGPRLFGQTTTPTAVPSAKRTTAPVPILEGTTDKRLVTVDPEVTDSRAAEIAAMFETYFTGINEKDYAAVAGVFDPAGDLDPGDPEQMAAFSDGTATTEDSDIRLTGVRDLANGRIRADLTFRSQQDAGDGPPGRLGETCTLWQVGYTLTSTDSGYRIYRGKGVSEPC